MFDPFRERESRPAQLSLKNGSDSYFYLGFSLSILCGLQGLGEEKISAKLKTFTFSFFVIFCVFLGPHILT